MISSVLIEHQIIITPDFNNGYCFNNYILPIESEEQAFRLSNTDHRVYISYSYVDYFKILPMLKKSCVGYRNEQDLFIDLGDGIYIQLESSEGHHDIFSLTSIVDLGDMSSDVFVQGKEVVRLDLPDTRE